MHGIQDYTEKRKKRKKEKWEKEKNLKKND